MNLSSLIGTLSTLLVLSACQPAPTESEISGEIQGTTYHIKVVLEGLPVKTEELRREIVRVFEWVDAKLSNYRDDSEISQINANKTSAWLPVSREILDLVEIAREVSKRSNGCYDLTVKPLFDLWGFVRHQNRIPTDAEIAEAVRHVGMSRIDVDLAGGRLRKRDPEVRIDLSSIAQGYTVGAIAALLESRGIQNYLAEIGGELKVKGSKGNGAAWRIAIEKPTPFQREVQRILEIHERNGTAVMTSGTYRNFFEQDGHVYSHILDPKTGRPVNHHLLSVTVLHDDPTWADAWGTALLCVGESEAALIAERERLKVLLIYRSGNELKELMSKEFLRARENSGEHTPDSAGFSRPDPSDEQ